MSASVSPVTPPPAEGPPTKSDTWIILVVVGALLFGGCMVIAVVAAIAIPNLIEARKGSNEAVAIGALRTLTTAQALYREGDKDKNNVLDYAGSLEDLERHGHLIDSVLASGVKQGYVFRIHRADEMRWSATATPAAPGKSGDRSFFVDESGLIRYRTQPPGAPASVNDSPLGR